MNIHLNDMQHPVRRSELCISCGRAKSHGLLICWSCHSRQKREHDGGYDPLLGRLIDDVGCGKITMALARLIYKRNVVGALAQ